MPVAAVLAVGAVVSAVGAKKAASAQVKAGNNAVAEQQRQFTQTQQTQQPFVDAGTEALGKLRNPQESFQASPGYNFVRSEGTRDLGNSFSAKGSALSGNALKKLDEFNQGLASQEFGNWWGQQAGLAGIGSNSANVLGAYGQNKANNVANINIGQGEARASGIEGVTNSLLYAGGQAYGASKEGAFARKPKPKKPNSFNPWAP